MYLVMLAYSLLMGQLRQNCVSAPASDYNRRSLPGHPPGKSTATLVWAIEQVTEMDRPTGQVIAQLGLG